MHVDGIGKRMDATCKPLIDVNAIEVKIMDNSTNVTTKFHHRYDTIISEENLNIVKIVFGIILLLPVSILGIIGNIVSLIVLCHHKVKTPTNFCLLALTLSDLLLLINAVLFVSINIYVHFDPLEGNNFRNSLFPYFGTYTSLVTARITSLLTTLLSIERFVAVNFPMKAKFICNKKTTLIGIITIYLLTIVLFMPFPFKYDVVHVLNNNRTVVKIVRNPALSEKFCRLYGIAMNCLFRFIPILLILLLNIYIMIIIRNTGKKRESLSSPNSESQSQEQRKITVMLLVVSFTFLICILPGAINSLLQTTWAGYSRLGKSRNFQQCISYVTFWLEAVNSAVNFIIYMAMSARFYAVYRDLFYSAKTIIRQVSFGSLSKERSSFVIRRKCESQSSFTYSDEAVHQRLTNKHTRNDSYKRLLEKSGNGELVNGTNPYKSRHPTNGILYELSENSKSSGYKKDRSCESDDVKLKLLGPEPINRRACLVKHDTLETSVDDI